MKKSLLFLFLLSGYFNPVFAQYPGQLMGGSDTDVATGVCYDTGGSFSPFTAGYYQSNDGDFSSNNGYEDCFVTGNNLQGGGTWKTVFGGTQHDYLYDVTYGNGNVYVVGTSDSNDLDITGNHGEKDYLVAKLDGSGQLIWTKSFGGSGTDIATSIIFIDNHLWVLGYSNSTDGDVSLNKGNYDLWLLKLDTDGNLLWQKNYGGSDDDRSSDMDFIYDYSAQTPVLILAGYSKSSDGDLSFNHGDYDYWIVGIDADGNLLWQQSFGGSGSDIKPKISTGSQIDIDIIGSSNSTDGDITNPLGGYDAWWLTGNIYNNLLSIYGYTNVGGSNDDFGTDILNFPYPNCGAPVILMSFYSNSSDGNTYINHGGFDAWFVNVDYNNNYNTTEFFNYGGQGDDKFLSLPSFSFEYFSGDIGLYYYCVGSSSSIDLPNTTPHGESDAWEVYPGGGQSVPEYTINAKIYPNPVSHQLKIKVEEGNITRLWLYDLTGKLLIQEKMNTLSNTYTLNLQSISPGNYMLKIMTNKGMAVKKIMVK